MPSMQSHEYKMEPSLRRSCWYVIGATGVFMVTFAWVGRVILQKPWTEVSIGLAILGILATSMVISLQWRLRIDASGVSRRFCLRWDYWSWDAFASGHVVKLFPKTFFDSRRPWWCRGLGLDCLSEDDFREVMFVINRFYELPPPSEVGETLTVKYAWRRTAKFDKDGIQIDTEGITCDYGWDDIQHVFITRPDPKRRDFTHLVVMLPDQAIEFKMMKGAPTWRGATPEQLNAFFLNHVSPERIEVVAFGDFPNSRPHLEMRLSEARKVFREISVVLVIFLVALVGVLIAIALVDGVVKAIVMAAIVVVSAGLPIAFMYRVQQKSVSKLIESLDTLDNT